MRLYEFIGRGFAETRFAENRSALRDDLAVMFRCDRGWREMRPDEVIEAHGGGDFGPRTVAEWLTTDRARESGAFTAREV